MSIQTPVSAWALTAGLNNGLLRIAVEPSRIRDRANKAFENTEMVFHRNERARVLQVGSDSGGSRSIERIARSAASLCNYLQGNAIVVRQEDVFLITDGTLLKKGEDLFRMSRREIKEFQPKTESTFQRKRPNTWLIYCAAKPITHSTTKTKGLI